VVPSHAPDFKSRLDPDVTTRAKEHAAKEGESLSGLIERLLLSELGD
jgi:predicted HicB family RNase H-like nuclease